MTVADKGKADLPAATPPATSGAGSLVFISHDTRDGELAEALN